MKNKRKPPTPPDSLTETELSTFPSRLKAEWTEVDGAGREEKGAGRGKGAVEGTRTFLFLFQRSDQSWGGGKVCGGDLKWPMMMRSAQKIPFPRTSGPLKLGSGVTV